MTALANDDEEDKKREIASDKSLYSRAINGEFFLSRTSRESTYDEAAAGAAAFFPFFPFFPPLRPPFFLVTRAFFGFGADPEAPPDFRAICTGWR